MNYYFYWNFFCPQSVDEANSRRVAEKLAGESKFHLFILPRGFKAHLRVSGPDRIAAIRTPLGAQQSCFGQIAVEKEGEKDAVSVFADRDEIGRVGVRRREMKSLHQMRPGIVIGFAIDFPIIGGNGRVTIKTLEEDRGVVSRD